MRQKYSENYFRVGIIEVKISRAGPTTTVLRFFFSCYLWALCREFYGNMHSSDRPHCPPARAGMSATCRPYSQMPALLADRSLSWRHKTDPDRHIFLCWGLPTFTPFFFKCQKSYREILCKIWCVGYDGVSREIVSDTFLVVCATC